MPAISACFPHAHDLFATNDRALGAFKDPNVFGPFLIWPALVVLERMLARRVRLTDVLIVGILLFALLLSFSRGAWFHFAVSCVVMMVLAFLTAETDRARMRIFALSAIGHRGGGGVYRHPAVVRLDRDHVPSSARSSFNPMTSAAAAASACRNWRCRRCSIFPTAWARSNSPACTALQQHNVYLQAFLVYGWAGGMAYITLLAATLWTALRTVFVRTPWQPYLICAFAAFIGEMVEGFVIDTDHWRHFFLLLGMIWGLAAATLNYGRGRQVTAAGGKARPCRRLNQ